MKVSALIPTYNRRAFIFRAIDSVLTQTVPVDEIIVVDDGSTDGTQEAIRSHYGACIKVFRQENMGVSVARRRAIEEAHGEWIAFLDSDDEWLPERNAAFLRAASLVPKLVALIFGNTRFVTDQSEGNTVFDENGFMIDRDPYLLNDPLTELVWDMGRSRPCVLQSSFIRRSVLMDIGCFAEGLRHSEDFLAGLQIASGHSFAAIPFEVTRLYRTLALNESSLELTWDRNEDHRRAAMLGYAYAARTTSAKPWRALHEDAVRSLCKWRAQNGLPIRRLARDQFEFGVSARSVLFFCGAMLGPRFFRAGFAIKRRLRAL